MSPLHPATKFGALLVPLLTLASLCVAAPEVKFSGDVRLRYEEDWDSQTSNGTPRQNRERARVRVRLSAAGKLTDTLSFGVRARTGNPDSQQSPHLSFWSSDDQEDDLEGVLDRYFLHYQEGPLTAWAGRNNLPFWQQTEHFWDEDVTPTGFAATYAWKREADTLTLTGGAFLLPDGAVDLHGEMVGGQVRYVRPSGAGQLTLATGLYAMEGSDGAELLRNRNGARDYLVGQFSAQWSQPLAPNRPLVLGLDLLENFANYDAHDAAPYAPQHADETTGIVLSAVLGQLKQRHDWQIGYYYARIETLAVNASYAQDDWARFGSSTQSDLTDIKGHEFRAAYAITPNLNVMTRVFFVEAITSRQDGNRWRLDLNWKF